MTAELTLGLVSLIGAPLGILAVCLIATRDHGRQLRDELRAADRRRG